MIEHTKVRRVPRRKFALRGQAVTSSSLLRLSLAKPRKVLGAKLGGNDQEAADCDRLFSRVNCSIANVTMCWMKWPFASRERDGVECE
jgi:hypothetical protein